MIERLRQQSLRNQRAIFRDPTRRATHPQPIIVQTDGEIELIYRVYTQQAQDVVSDKNSRAMLKALNDSGPTTKVEFYQQFFADRTPIEQIEATISFSRIIAAGCVDMDTESIQLKPGSAAIFLASGFELQG